MSIISGIVPIVFAACFIWMPETPQYLLKRGKEDEAEKSLQYFRGKDCDIKNELDEMKDDVDQQMKNKASTLTLLVLINLTKWGCIFTGVLYWTLPWQNRSKGTVDLARSNVPAAVVRNQRRSLLRQWHFRTGGLRSWAQILQHHHWLRPGSGDDSGHPCRGQTRPQTAAAYFCSRNGNFHHHSRPLLLLPGKR